MCASCVYAICTAHAVTHSAAAGHEVYIHIDTMTLYCSACVDYVHDQQYIRALASAGL